jgi:polar amino acid transport system substrate-binding protein
MEIIKTVCPRNCPDTCSIDVTVFRTVSGYTNTKEFDEATSFTKDPAKDELTNFKKLVAGRIDLLVADKFVGLDLIKNNMPDKVNDIEFMSNSLQDMDLCLSKKKEMSDKYN